MIHSMMRNSHSKIQRKKMIRVRVRLVIIFLSIEKKKLGGRTKKSKRFQLERKIILQNAKDQAKNIRKVKNRVHDKRLNMQKKS